MKATAQRPGPSGSRVVKKKSSFPRLGDGLLSLLDTKSDAVSPSDDAAQAPPPSKKEIGASPQLAGQNEEQSGLDATCPSDRSTPVSSTLKEEAVATKAGPSHGTKNVGLGNFEHVFVPTVSSRDSTLSLGEISFTSEEASTPGQFSNVSGDGAALSSPNSTPPTSAQATLPHIAAVKETPSCANWAPVCVTDLFGSRTLYQDKIDGVAEARRCSKNTKVEAREPRVLPQVSSVDQYLPGAVPYPTIAGIKLITLDSKLAAKRLMTSASSDLHIFIDMSNIIIGFYDSYKISRQIPLQQWIKPPQFDFQLFDRILTRGRQVDKRILAGSLSNAASDRVNWPSHFIEAEQLGYTMNIFHRVQKLSPAKQKRQRRAPLQGVTLFNPYDMSTTSADESTEDGMATPKYVTKNAEQGVDENLHLNMSDSIMDCERPGTMVIATGDAAQAEFSEGFMKYVERALRNGWTVELVSWSKTISSAWTKSAFRSKYGKQFRIIYLDDFLEELITTTNFLI